MKKLILTSVIVALVAFYAGLVVGYNMDRPEPATEAAESKPLSKYEVGPPTAEELLELVNAERKKVGVAPLTIDENVQKSAQLKADDMAERNYFSHNVRGTDKVLTPEMNRLLVASCQDSSENIQITEKGTSQDALDWWKQSKPHYEAMINPQFTTTGFGVSYAEKNGDFIKPYISVQHFCVAK